MIAEHDLPAYTVGVGSKGCVAFATEKIVDYKTFKSRQDPELFELAWLWSMNRGLYTTPGREEEWTMSVAHDDEAVDRYVEVFAGLAAEISRRPSGSARA